MKKIFLVLIAAVALAGCGTNEANAGRRLPQGAVLVRDYGNGWVKFNLEGKHYLYHRSLSDYRESLTQIR